VAGGAAAVIDALAEIVAGNGALLFPNLNIPHAFTAVDPPRFDLKQDPVRQFVGVIPELFKFAYAEHFSIHPTHSLMGIGNRAEELLAGHENVGLCCGPGTPWEKNALAGGKILLIGVTQSCNTTYHCAEESIDDPYQLTPDTIDGTVIIDGRELTVPSRLHLWGNHADFNIINDELQERGFLTTGKVGNAQTMCLDAAGLLQVSAERFAEDPRYFLGK